MNAFKPLGFRLLRESDIVTLREHAADPRNVETLMSTKTGTEYGLSRVNGWMPKMFPLLARLKVTCLIPYEVGIYYVPAGVELKRHVDWRTTARHCTISAINPGPWYNPTLFYESSTAEDFCLQMDLNDLPALMNTQVYHAVQSSDQPRLNFQVYFAKPFDEVAELIQQKKLFRPGAAVND